MWQLVNMALGAVLVLFIVVGGLAVYFQYWTGNTRFLLLFPIAALPVLTLTHYPATKKLPKQWRVLKPTTLPKVDLPGQWHFGTHMVLDRGNIVFEAKGTEAIESLRALKVYQYKQMYVLLDTASIEITRPDGNGLRVKKWYMKQF
jgi:hypothetical protein